MSRKRLVLELFKYRALFNQAAAFPAQATPALQHGAAHLYRCPSVVQAYRCCRGFSGASQSARNSAWCSVSTLLKFQHVKPDVDTRHTHSEPQLATAPCWFCSEALQPVSLLLCPNCGYIQQVREDVNYFQLFGLEENYDVDLGKLQKTLQKLQLMVHPDKHSTKGDDVRQLAEQQSSLLNKAFTALKSPLERARYLLEVKGSPVQEDARLDDSKFLMEVMELREEVAEAAGEDRVCTLLAANEERRQAWEGKILQAFAAGQLSEAERLVFEMAYWDRIEEQLKEKL